MAAPCLTEEDIAELLERGLGASGAGPAAEDHLGSCPRCRRLLSAAVQLRDEEPASNDDGQDVDRIGRYVLEREVGAGAMGVVYAARDEELDRLVALKLLRPLAAGTDLVAHEERLRREAQAMAKLAHPSVVHVYEIGRAADQLFVAMELIDGQSLTAWLAAAPRSERDIARVFIEAGRGLVAAHETGLVHRDFKPDNVLIGREGRVCVADFGMARSSAELPRAASLDGSSTLTQTGAFVGTPAYMAPEVLAGGESTARSDQFSFAVSLFEAAHGQRPFVARDLGALLDGIRKGVTATPQRPASRWLRRLIDRGLAHDPAQRFASMQEFVAALEGGIAPPARLRWRTFGAIVAVAVALVALGVRHLRRPSPACARVEARTRSLLTPDHRAVMRAAFVQAAPAYGADAFERVAASLDRYAGQLDVAREACCGRNAASGDLAAALRLACVERSVDEAEAMVQLLAHADADRVAQAMRAVSSLSPPELCGSDHRPRVAEPDHEEVTRLRARVAQVKAEEAAGDFRTGLADAERCAADARKLGSKSAQAEADFMLGLLRYRNDDKQGANAALHASVTAAEGARLDELAAKAWTLMIEINGDVPEEATRDEERARAAVDRLDGRDDLRAGLLYSRGAMQESQSHLADALASYEEARALTAKLPSPNELAIASIDDSISVVFSELNRPADALAAASRALSAVEGVLGPQHPRVADALDARATAYSRAGRFTEAVADARRALAINRAVLGPQHQHVADGLLSLAHDLTDDEHADLAVPVLEEALAIREHAPTPDADRIGPLIVSTYVYDAAHRYADAERAGRRAIVLLEALPGPPRPDLGAVHSFLGRVKLETSAPREALVEYEAALVAFRAALGDEHPEVANAFLGIGRARLALHQDAAAVTALEETLRRREASKVAPPWLAQARFALAGALPKAASSRACSLAEAARAGYAGGDQPTNPRQQQLDEVRAWLAAHCAP